MIDKCKECGQLDCTKECNCEDCQSWHKESESIKKFFNKVKIDRLKIDDV